MELKKQQLMKDIKVKENVITRREMAERNFQIQMQTLEPDQFHSQQLKEGNSDDLSYYKTQWKEWQGTELLWTFTLVFKEKIQKKLNFLFLFT